MPAQLHPAVQANLTKAVERHGRTTPTDRRPGGRRQADRTTHAPPLAPAALPPIGHTRPSPPLRILGVHVSPVVALAAVVVSFTMPAAALAGEAAKATGGNTTAVVSAITGVIGAVVGVYVTARKTNGDLRSQIQKDAQAWIDAQSDEISELRKATRDLRSEVGALSSFREDVVTYLHRDKAWHEVVTTLLHANGIAAPAPPPMPDITH